MKDGRLHDGEVFKLKDCENSTIVEFVNTPGRGIAWRMYNRIGGGILLTHEEAEKFKKLLDESLDDHYENNGYVERKRK